MTRDYRLVCAARDEGSHQAYADLMALYREPLRLLLLRMTRSATATEDLVMETFGKAFRQLHRYAPTSTFSAWLYSIGVHTYIDHLRRNRLQTVPLSAAAQNADGDYVEYQIASGQPNPEETLIRRQRDERLRAAVEQMKEPYRQMIQLRYYEDLSYEEMASRLGIPLGTVKVRLSRAKEQLSAALRQEGGEL